MFVKTVNDRRLQALHTGSSQGENDNEPKVLKPAELPTGSSLYKDVCHVCNMNSCTPRIEHDEPAVSAVPPGRASFRF